MPESGPPESGAWVLTDWAVLKHLPQIAVRFDAVGCGLFQMIKSVLSAFGDGLSGIDGHGVLLLENTSMAGFGLGE
jgi:hypothetical protein